MHSRLEFYRMTFGLSHDEINDLIKKHDGDLRAIIDEIISAPAIC